MPDRRSRSGSDSAIQRILVVTKRSGLDLLGGRRALRRWPAANRKALIRSDRENRRTQEVVFEHLRRAGVEFRHIPRDRLRRPAGRWDLVLVLGGDGTFFAAAEVCGAIPVLAVNSDPTLSMGFFTCCDRRSFAETFAQARHGALSVRRLNTACLTIPGRGVRRRVINDVLFAHSSPVAMTRYILVSDGRAEYQESSGVWASTAAGSTGAVLSAGGRAMSIGSTRLQWVTREPYEWRRRIQRRRGLASRSVEIRPLRVECGVWVDGNREMIAVEPGDRILLTTPGEPLDLLFHRRRSPGTASTPPSLL